MGFSNNELQGILGELIQILGLYVTRVCFDETEAKSGCKKAPNRAEGVDDWMQM